MTAVKLEHGFENPLFGKEFTPNGAEWGYTDEMPEYPGSMLPEEEEN